MSQPVYIDPLAKHGRLSLIGELTKLPSRPKHSPAEDQLTAAVAWLADRSTVFANEFCKLVLGADDEALDALAIATDLSADVQVRLPSVGAGFLWADLSIAAPAHAFQLLVEVKLTSDFHQYEIADVGTLSQPEAYLHAWRSCAPESEAAVRRLGTLTLDGKAPPSTDPWRARNVTWAQVHELLMRISSELADEVRLVAEDLRDHLAGRVLPPEISADFLEQGARLTRGVCERLRPRVREGKISGNFKPNARFHYVGGYLQFLSPEGTREKLWFVVTPAGGDYNVPGAPASIQMASVYEEPLSAPAKARLVEAGFTESKDKIGYRLVRAALPLEDLGEESMSTKIADAADWAVELLATAGFTA